MNIIQTFLSKWGLIILIVFSLLTFFNTCGVKGKVDRLDKKVISLDKDNVSRDSILIIKNHIDMEIYNLKVERSVLHNMNEIVLKNIRPSERISQIDEKLDELNKQQLKQLNNK